MTSDLKYSDIFLIIPLPTLTTLVDFVKELMADEIKRYIQVIKV